MKHKTLSPGQRKKGGKFLPALCNLFGTLILLSVIAACLPMIVPRFMGYEIYNIVSGSMEPAIPVGSVIYVEPIAPEDVQEGEVIAFMSDESVIAHRVVENQRVEGEITTKGDANDDVDMTPVNYDAVIGRVAKHYPMLGAFMEIYTTNAGKIYIIIFAACGAMLNIIASRMRELRRVRE